MKNIVRIIKWIVRVPFALSFAAFFLIPAIMAWAFNQSDNNDPFIESLKALKP